MLIMRKHPNVSLVCLLYCYIVFFSKCASSYSKDSTIKLPLPLPPPTPPLLPASRGPEYTEALQPRRTSKLELSAKAINGSECSSTVISKGITNNA